MSLNLDESGYRGLALERLISSGANIGDTIRVGSKDESYTGILMPRSQLGSDCEHIVLKLESGYNIGIRIQEDTEVTRVKHARRRKAQRKPISRESDSLPVISVLSTGGTIASKVDYRTGAVNPALSAQDLYDTVPEIRNYANIRAKIVMSKLSENIHPDDWGVIARAVATEIRKGADGVVVAHGTDTMAFTAAALSFALQNLPVPVVLVGSQRSSDRPSSDAAMNLTGAIILASRADAAEVMVLMHGKTDDSNLYAHRGTRVRKLHTSRRDAFQSVNEYPLYEVNDSVVKELHPPLLRRDKERKLSVRARFEPQVSLIKVYPGMSSDSINHLVETGYRGIVLEGTGLGHAPSEIKDSVQSAIDNGVVVLMTSQCIFGRVDMNVYRTGVELLDLGVIPCQDMLAETALVKLMWALANTKDPKKVTALIQSQIAGETSMRSEMPAHIKHLGGD
ncbi:MAG: Glu-tRNA(Gln) amidotransferase GatDE subunit D [Candidatus Thorarchaeota archaeon]|nr:MAG: Glu-tRNA(Gln) amidotransferase GatDE subunit D [Candidatus Thorarchaeota archaeon]